MLEQGEPVQSEVIVSLLNWWAEAGIDALVDEAPHPWLGRVSEDQLASSIQQDREPRRAERAAQLKPTGQQQATKATMTPPPDVPLALPPTLPDLVDWLSTTDALPFIGPAKQRLPASGSPSPLMVLIEMPDHDDIVQGRLINGEAGALFEKMLGAMGRSRDDTYIAAFCPGRTPSGRLQPEEIDILLPIARHHIALARPKGVWIMGQAVSRALLGADDAPGLGRLREINHEGGTVEAVASYSPRFLLQQPKRKGAAWADMQALMRGIDT
jgi:DNA polymerase